MKPSTATARKCKRHFWQILGYSVVDKNLVEYLKCAFCGEEKQDKVSVCTCSNLFSTNHPLGHAMNCDMRVWWEAHQ